MERVLDAVDFVCLNCGKGEESCEVCPVRKLVERIEEFEIVFDDLYADTKKQLVEFLGGENGNYDVVPLARIELDEDEEEE